MKRIVRAAVAALALGAGSGAFAACDAAPSRCPGNPALPAAVVRLLPPGYTVLDHLAGSLTDAGRTDYLVVVARPAANGAPPSPRPLLVFTQRADGGYALAARNDHVVMRADEGGVSGDPYLDLDSDGLAIKHRYFSVQNGVAGGPNHWSDNVTFHYDPARRTWLFHQRIVHDSEMNRDPSPNADALLPDHVTVERADRARPVTFEARRPQR
ncbi:hypothetical protein [Burkholderia glumae]|uniref:hypothetical protein n=1 Tax=Burkholderia glumae TaxID=337 RepID=UPI00129724A1|nr:hypothetical protein [Burkholderia glumae]MCM2551613.1 hypothetical protein [Burkholderia glumae]NVE25438.1 hypothetical protein [Burkholderia glumae]QGA39503.1 hypothetical protein GAS19_17775 [Burkholderia glumae]QJP69406.1 hypothetical protein HJC54_03190 [Burkholderia glumae]